MYIKSLNGIRALAFIAIFIHHTPLLGNDFDIGGWGVSVFLILSGFLMIYNYIDRPDIEVSPFKFAAKKIKRLYPLHIVCFVIMAVFCAAVWGLEASVAYEAPLNIMLLQAWIPNTDAVYSFNGPSWYLCLCVLCYFCFPAVLKIYKSIKKINLLFLALFGLLVLQVFIAFIARTFGAPNTKDWFSMEWITYNCPLSRLIDFLLGCTAARIFKLRKPLNGKALYSVFEILTVFAVAIAIYLANNHNIFTGSAYLRYVGTLTVPNLLLIYVFAREKGIISKLLSIKPISFIGDISPYAFLIHNVFIVNVKYIIHQFSPVKSDALHIISAFVLTVAAAYLWKKYVAERKKAKNYT